MIDGSLEWQRGQYDRWDKGVSWFATHRDASEGRYRLRLQVREYTLHMMSKLFSGTWEPRNVVERHWIAEYDHPTEPGAIIVPSELYRGHDLRAARRAAEKHHLESRRKLAWARYHRENDPPC
ncbi:hypothetical protein [Mycobacteroides abscessus]|uniref:hypothetical protein n=1 Tax=Mycobacteroides abscessus TaxID=36809 RepID=UPI0009A8C7A8|nr:hypothetical protein [Mycobacteroides abscessus]SKW04251.1 Uncharacterised protein [Mycobacteroides abscessus subsp. abscessus]